MAFCHLGVGEHGTLPRRCVNLHPRKHWTWLRCGWEAAELHRITTALITKPGALRAARVLLGGGGGKVEDTAP